ncbi:MAG: HlyC/CorC family transporter [Gemmatimonadetes bacterium]|nr:HlyC/CorC family transporter [Gemmatimonadota bacterium]
MLPLGAALLLALILSACVTSAELAIFSLSDARIRTLREERFRGSSALGSLRAAPERLVMLLRLLSALAKVSAAALAGYSAGVVWGEMGLALAIGVVSLLILLGADLIPMTFAVKHGVRIALTVAPPLLVLERVLRPLLLVLERLMHFFPERLRSGLGVTITESEIRQLTALGHREGVIEEHERQLIERAFRLDETKAWDIMTPRVDMFAWRDSLTLTEIAPQLRTVPYSRVPVYGQSIDNVTGVLYLRDTYQALVSGQRDVPLSALAREPLIVPGSVSLTKLLRDFQTRRIHLAIVVDEYGGTDGLVTLEDVLEELVGEIVDETDLTEEEPIVRISRNEIIAAGDADLREINHVFNTSFPQLEHRSLNGYLLEELGRVPDPGERLEREGVVMEVLEASETQVVRARLRRGGPAGEPAAAAAQPAATAGGAGAPEPRPAATPRGATAPAEEAAIPPEPAVEAGTAAERRRTPGPTPSSRARA